MLPVPLAAGQVEPLDALQVQVASRSWLGRLSLNNAALAGVIVGAWLPASTALMSLLVRVTV